MDFPVSEVLTQYGFGNLGPPNSKISISERSLIPLSYSKKDDQLGRTNLIFLSQWGAHKSILFQQVVHLADNRYGIFRVIM